MLTTGGIGTNAIGTVPIASGIIAISITVSGTVTEPTDEDDIVLGGKTIILTISGDTWVAAGAAFDAIRQDIINGLNGV